MMTLRFAALRETPIITRGSAPVKQFMNQDVVLVVFVLPGKVHSERNGASRGATLHT